MKVLLTLVLLVFEVSFICAQGQPRRVDVRLVANACLMLKKFGVEFDVKNVVLLNSLEETKERFQTYPDRDRILSAVAFAEFGKFPVYINTWDVHLWRGIANEEITDPAISDSAAVIAASLIYHEMYHAREPVNAFDNLAPPEKTARIYQSEIGALSEELRLLLFFKKKGVANLAVPIAETEKSISDLKILQTSNTRN